MARPQLPPPITVRLDREQLAFLNSLGGGNRTKALRHVLTEAMALHRQRQATARRRWLAEQAQLQALGINPASGERV
ncbi:hypothetical protein KBZ18_10020 [Synechococcus sp. Cruz-9H2]|uniref:hypothetical protein n=1 Tax=unclassified Synechococcus TaxID=2626047 RepID=UPI0020CCB88E|nr:MULTISPECIES: hypothetical protein [unclassified Synechococcus]MCP9819828.1 hypothetical protein [Synechococcus sp. Cruz-9H2]MCP9844106.1 hypothetical protein [Synechococcus sp. Edmonson 11F2]MCP9856258.1 hypothetical protein [Synechococcus sp. Cruz-9C9]MCP9863543.1 hypothetical protein [Synechococcus sp. Cruz-7E5]MCP9870739.1 hypothetical protein [Synechococcus sp. Cruz-7B9]